MPLGSGKGRGNLSKLNKTVRAGKRVIFVTPHAVAAKEEAEKAEKRGFRSEIKKEKDDMGNVVYVVYVFEGGFV